MRTLRVLVFTALLMAAVVGLWKAAEVWAPEPLRSSATAVERATATQLIQWWAGWRPTWVSQM